MQGERKKDAALVQWGASGVQRQEDRNRLFLPRKRGALQAGYGKRVIIVRSGEPGPAGGPGRRLRPLNHKSTGDG